MASTAESGSSRTRIFGSQTSARASAMRCFCPPESCTPRSPTTVSKLLRERRAPPRAPAPRAPRRGSRRSRLGRVGVVEREADVARHGRREEERVLLRVADRRPHRRERQIADVDAVEEHRAAAAWAGGARGASRGSILPEPVRPTIASDSPAFTSKRDAVEHLALAVGERQVRRRAACPRRASGARQRAVDDLGAGVEDLPQARVAGAAALDDREREAERDHRPRHAPERRPEREEVPLREPAVRRPVEQQCPPYQKRTRIPIAAVAPRIGRTSSRGAARARGSRRGSSRFASWKR